MVRGSGELLYFRELLGLKESSGDSTLWLEGLMRDLHTKFVLLNLQWQGDGWIGLRASSRHSHSQCMCVGGNYSFGD